MQTRFSGPRIELEGKVDRSLCYGDGAERRKHLVAIEAKTAEALSGGVPQLLSYMLCVQHYQQVAGKVPRPLFGLLSDGDHFNFYRLYECRYCCLELRWFIPEHRQQILDLLAKLCREALAAATPRGSEAMETTSG
ncbi:hypothetical protein BP00DRAFT_446115 [Aspergillus indologenus CBS 114.80]|uniref:Uncharacterized protein n=1 Tax=Aspergillus indologenus CBS 114.80 TaxID=1450541 RepID=A0A2V5JAA0_9EURO|nr:hypothetical protein BP00DRAFT_446115 [Aspergillus indologenus CBS 114.80]